MKKNEYLSNCRDRITEIIESELFFNNKSQIFAKNLGAEFLSTYSEKEIWNKLLTLTTNSSIILMEDPKDELALKGLKTSAEIYENLANISKEFDNEFSLILSALCYDISGYQANALSVIKDLEVYNFEGDSASLSYDNLVISQIQQFLLKKIPLLDDVLKTSLEKYEGDYFLEGLSKLVSFILSGEDSDYFSKIQKGYKKAINNRNLYLSQILLLFLVRIKKFEGRSLWRLLEKQVSSSEKWAHYLKLLSNDLYGKKNMKEIDKKTSIFELWVSQIYAITQGILDKDNQGSIIQMPTSAGKTFIAELVILDNLIKSPKKKCIYISPYNSLTKQIERDLSQNLSRLGYNVSTLLGSYDTDDFQNLVMEETNVLIATPEKVDLLFRIRPDFFSDVSTLVVDEGHVVGDLTRGVLAELLITRLKMKVPDLKICFISAVMDLENAKEFSTWLTGNKNNVIQSPNYLGDEPWEPTRKVIGILRWKNNAARIDYPNVDGDKGVNTFIANYLEQIKIGRKFYPKPSDKGETACFLAYKLAKMNNCMIFCSKPDWAISTGKKFLKLLDLYESHEKLPPFFEKNENKESVYFAKKWYGENSIIVKCLIQGIGIHFGNMPQQVRGSIEKDYSNGLLKVLIATNTVSQGINFPVKNLIIHSLVQGKEQRVKVRDFWNLVGRAGRAGKETEGHIIFLSNSPSDERLFKNHLDKKNIEHCTSIYAIMLKYLQENKIDENRLQELFDFYSESYFLNVLFEEMGENIDEKTLENILDHSLFRVQTKDIDTAPIKKAVSNLFSKINRNINNKEMGSVFSKTGFCILSNKKIFGFINKNKEEIIEIIEKENLASFLEIILENFGDKDIRELKTDLELGGDKLKNVSNLIIRWIQGESIEDLVSSWEKYFPDTKYDFYKFINDLVTYKLPWGINAFVSILSYTIKKDLEELPDFVKDLQSFVKYGVNNKYASFLMNLGIKNREIALKLSKKGSNSMKEFYRSFINLDIETLKNLSITNEYDLENIFEIISKLNNPDFFNDAKSYTFKIKGIFYEKERKDLSKTVKKGDILELERQSENEHDPYAILIKFQGGELGFIPRELAKMISLNIDLQVKKFKVSVLDVNPLKDYSEVLVEIK